MDDLSSGSMYDTDSGGGSEGEALELEQDSMYGPDSWPAGDEERVLGAEEEATLLGAAALGEQGDEPSSLKWVSATGEAQELPADASDGAPRTATVDQDGDGRDETWVYDTAGSGTANVMVVDTNGDGQPDSEFIDPKGEGEWTPLAGLSGAEAGSAQPGGAAAGGTGAAGGGAGVYDAAARFQQAADQAARSGDAAAAEALQQSADFFLQEPLAQPWILESGDGDPKEEAKWNQTAQAALKAQYGR